MKQIYNFTLFLFLLTFNFTKAQDNSINLDGVDDNIPLNHFERPDTFTLEVWLKTNNISSLGTIISWATDITTNNTFSSELTIYNGNVFYAEFDGTNFPLTSFADISDGNWHHIAVTRNNNSTDNVKFYLDGNLLSTNTINIDIVSDNLRIGNVLYGGLAQKFFNGTIEELRIWNFEKTATEIQNQMNLELMGSETGLLTYYSFNQGIANGNNSTITSLTDNSSNNINGTLNNFTLNSTTSNWVDGIDFSTLSINSVINNNKTVQIFPNPSTDFIKVSGLIKTFNYKIYNSLGAEVISGTISNNETITTQNLTNGLYFLKFKDRNTIKFVKN